MAAPYDAIGGDVDPNYGAPVPPESRPDIRLVTDADVDAVSISLARAFHDDPVKLHLTGGTTLSEQRVAPFFRAFQRMQMPHGHVYTTADLGAAAIWAPPGHWKVPFTSVLKNAPTFLKLYGWRFLPNLQVLSDMERKHPDDPHYYLEIIGTDPAHQGKGYGTALMRPMVERADAEGVGMYLESSKESNVPFYARFGFEVRDTLDHRRGGPRMWLMWREPR